MEGALLGVGLLVLGAALAGVARWRYGPPWLAAAVGVAGSVGLGYAFARPGAPFEYALAFAAMAVIGCVYCALWLELHIDELRNRISQLQSKPDQDNPQHPERASVDNRRE